MLNALRNDVHFAWTDGDGAVAEVDTEVAFEDEECLVGVVAIRPDKVAFESDEFELIVVQFCNDPGLKLVRMRVNLSAKLMAVRNMGPPGKGLGGYSLPGVSPIQ
jgi:hypothetical protein